MTADDVEHLVDEQIAGQWDRWTAHNLDLRHCIVRPPSREVFVALTPEGDREIALWRVVEEDPDRLSGYIVVYDEASNSFGLALRDPKRGNVFLGAHGDLWDTLEGM